ncbi:MAG: hypothetical protein ACI80V_002766 [Rhodothermales bacterium]
MYYLAAPTDQLLLHRCLLFSPFGIQISNGTALELTKSKLSPILSL